ncbi:MAG: hypothetical protein GC161_16840 [Planctomycetaceae bacterium]|nr:hypothetical protein [Planctomycetaceae bacterium]
MQLGRGKIGALVAGAGLVALGLMALPKPQKAPEPGWTVVEKVPAPETTAEEAAPVAPPEPAPQVEVEPAATQLASQVEEEALPVQLPVERIPDSPPGALLRAEAVHGGELFAVVRSVGSLGQGGEFAVRAEHTREGTAASLALAEQTGRKLEGWLLERVGTAEHLRGWFELPAGASDVSLPFLGRWVDVELTPEGETAELGIESGPRTGWRPPVHAALQLQGGQTARLWVPQQAAALVATSADGRRTRAILATGETSVRLRLPSAPR